jgi:predicted GNAT family acetyltransferase
MADAPQSDPGAKANTIPEVRDNPAAHRLEVVTPSGVAFAEYRLEPGIITFTHTLVPERLRGQGLGGRLIEAGLAMARARGLKVIPVCPFFRAHMRAHPETHDLLAPQGRALLGP